MLRSLEPEDLELLYTIENDASQWWVSSQTAPLSRYQLRDYIANNSADIYKDEQVRFVIEAEGTAVGLIDLFNFSAQHRRAELGVAILSKYQHHGYARQAINEIMRYATDILSLKQIYAIVPVSNQSSRKMLLGAGFVESAVLHDWVRVKQSYDDAIVFQKVF